MASARGDELNVACAASTSARRWRASSAIGREGVGLGRNTELEPWRRRLRRSDNEPSGYFDARVAEEVGPGCVTDDRRAAVEHVVDRRGAASGIVRRSGDPYEDRCRSAVDERFA